MEGTMKKIALILSLLLMFSLVACAGGDEESSAFSAATSSATSNVSSSATSDDSAASSEASSEASVDSSDVSDDSSEASDESGDESGDESEGESDFNEDDFDYGTLFLNKAKTAPVVDGVIGNGEYATVIKYDITKEYWSADSTDGAEAYNATLYITWDEQYLYTAVEIGAGRPRTYGNTDYLQNRPYIFDRRHVMSAIILGDPDEDRYKPNSAQADTDADDPLAWDWGAASNSKLGTEWTTTAQPDGSNISADHFGSLTKSEGYEFIVAVSKLNSEIYEQRIPWSALNDAASFTATAGANIGYAFSACCEEVDLEDDEASTPYACFGAGIVNGKAFSRYVGFILKD